MIWGPMFSGKTVEVLNRIRRDRVAKYVCIVIKHEVDTRYHDSNVLMILMTHDLDSHTAISTRMKVDF